MIMNTQLLSSQNTTGSQTYVRPVMRQDILLTEKRRTAKITNKGLAKITYIIISRTWTKCQIIKDLKLYLILSLKPNK